MMSQPHKMHEQCPTCGGHRSCEVVFCKEYTSPVGVFDIWEKRSYFLLECMGCSTCFFMVECRFSEDVDQSGQPEVRRTYYPKTGHRPAKIEWADLVFIKEDISSLYTEIIQAINENLIQLASIGIRTLIDRIALSTSKPAKTENTFTKNLQLLLEGGHITASQHDALSAAVGLGGSVVHRVHIPNKEEVELCLDIVEHIMESIIIMNVKTQKIKSVTPKRKKIKKINNKKK